MPRGACEKRLVIAERGSTLGNGPITLFEEPRCNLCQSNDPADRRVLFDPVKRDVDVKATFSASHGILGTQRIVRCGRCNLVYVCPRLNASEVVEAYGSSVDELYVSQAEARVKTFQKCAKLVAGYAPPPGRLLDVGAAAGFFCKAASDLGWHTTGIEPSGWLAGWGRDNLSLDVRTGILEPGVFPENHFDVVTMWDSIEHMSDPLGTLEVAAGVMRPNATLVINTPDFGSVWAKVFGQRWWFLLSHHIYYFTARTLKAMLDKAGFDTVAVRRHYQTLELAHLVKMVGLYSKPVSSVAGGIISGVGMGKLPIPYYASQMNVIARKR